MKNVIRGASSAALLVGLGGLNGAWAQQGTATPAPTAPQNQTVTTSAPAPQTAQTGRAPAADQTTAQSGADSGERVIVTGSLIATLPEDAPKPVEVYTSQDLKEQGSPTISEFVRSLTVAYGSDFGFGEATPDVPTGAGFNSPDIRGLGPNATLTLLNGRRLATTNGGFGADINTIPSGALEAVEVLKDGASTTYGAGAVGGVINFRTRRDIDAPQFNVSRTIYDGSDGKWEAGFLTGWVGDAANLLVNIEYSHEDSMLQDQRSFSSLPFNVNPDAYSLNPANPGRFIHFTNFHPGGAASALAATSPRIQDYRTAADCTAIGGEITNVLQPGATVTTGIPNDGCAIKQFEFQDLVNENTTLRNFVEFNADISENMEFHIDATYSKSETFSNGLPTFNPTTRAVQALSVAGTACGAANGCQFAIPVQVATYNTAGAIQAGRTTNPFIADFVSRTGATLANGDALYTAVGYRPFLYGGNPSYDDGPRKDRFQRERFLINTGVKGEFSQDGLFGFLSGINYDYAVQYNQYLQTNRQHDVIVSRLQNALLGYGGPQCNAVDRVVTDYTSSATYNRTVGIQSDTLPGSNGCLWFNPFASAWSTSFANGAANPQYNAALANPRILTDWLTQERFSETQYQSTTVDATWTGEVPDSLFALPGGNVGWAAGVQWRQIERRDQPVTHNNVEEQMALARCPWPDPQLAVSNRDAPNENIQEVGSTGCATAIGAFLASGPETLAYSDEQAVAFYAELQLPVLENVNLSASVRREDFDGGKLTGDIYSLAGKWDITDNFYFRSSYSTNFRAQGLDEIPGNVEFDTESPGRFGSVPLLRQTITSPSFGPEDDKTINVGFGYQGELGDGRLRASLDFFEILIDGQVATTSTANVFNNVFGANSAGSLFDPDGSGPITPTTNSTNQYADCGARLVSFVEFSSPCVTGTTTAANITAINRFILNGPGFITNGLDYNVNWSQPLFDGTFSANLQATQNLHYKARGYDVNGVIFDLGGDRLGYNNVSRSGSASTEWRANLSLRWANENHNINLRADYLSGYLEEGYAACQAPYYNTTTNTQVSTLGNTTACGGGLIAVNLGQAGAAQYSTYGVDPGGQFTYNATYIYTAPFWEELEFRFSVINLTDEDPYPFQSRAGFLSGLVNPRGRQFELEVTKRF